MTERKKNTYCLDFYAPEPLVEVTSNVAMDLDLRWTGGKKTIQIRGA